MFCCNYFKYCHAFHSFKLTGKTAAAYHIATEEFPALFSAVIAGGGYTMRQVFNLYAQRDNNTCFSLQKPAAVGKKC
jgi:hypothetical protein